MHSQLLIRSLVVGCITLGLAALGSTAQAADLDTQVVVNIPAQPLDSALLELSKQASFQLVLDSGVVTAKNAAAISGKMPIRQALERLLSHTELSYQWSGDHTVTIAPRARLRPAGDTTATAPQNDPTDRVLLAQVNEKPLSKASDKDRPTVKTAEKPAQKVAKLEEVIVTGSRIPTTAGQQVQPVRSYTREDIEVSGQSTIGDFLNTLPEVSTSNNSTFQAGVAGMQTVQLHGLPVGTTLTLLDGRRLDQNIFGFFDLSNIPLAAVERVEILPVGASAIYGADALAGAVNTILRKDFNGFEANATLEHAPGVNDPSANLAWGKSWDRGSVSLIGSYQERGELLGTRREPWSLTSLPASLPASVLSAIGSYSCAPGNVYSVDGSNLPGLSSPYAAIPAGITGKPTIGQFTSTAGKQNLCNQERYADTTPETQREGALLSAHYQVAESADLFTEVLFSHQHLKYQLGPQISVSESFGGTVSASNPNNPFGEAVNVSFAYPGTGLVQDEFTSLIRPLIGVRGTFLSDWHYEATVTLSRAQFHDEYSITDFQLISNALASSNPTTALNPFASGAPGTPQLLSSLTNPASDTFSAAYDDRTVRAQGFLRGPVMQLPAGAVQAVIGSEYSREKQEAVITQFGSDSLHRNTYAVFSEARVPLLAGDAASPKGERLTLTVAGRYDHSDDFGGKTTWQSGLLWHATETISFSGGYGQSYQAPQLAQISGPQSVSPGVFIAIDDPFRGNQLITYPITYVSGPNFNLKPETGDSFTLGLQYLSQALQGLHASLTWYDLKLSNYIGAETLQTLVGNPSLFPGAVIRAPPTAQDQQQGFLGVINQINYVDYNFGDLRVAGFDADVRYVIDTRAGQFTPSVAIANIYKWQSALLPGTPAIDGLSQATFFGVGWAPRWKGTAALAWKQGPLSMNLAGRYIGRYQDYHDFGVPNTHEIGNTWIFDFNARYEIGQALASTNPWVARSYVAFGVVNLLNKTPPLSYTPFWYDVEQYDIRGRYLHLNAGLRF